MKTKPTPIASAVAIALLGAMLPVHAQQAAAAPAAAASAPAGTETQRVEVVGIRASREAALTKKRNSETLVEVVTAEDVGKMPDKNVADAIQRVPGVNIASSAGGEGGFSEADRVSLRGTSPSLTQTLVNGHALSTGDWFVLNLFGTTVGRSISYSLLPSELVGNVVVHKVASADQPDGGVAGSVDVQTRHPLDFKKPFTGEVQLGATYQTLAAKTDPQFNALLAWHDLEGKQGFLLQVFDEKQHLRRDGQEVLGYFAINGAGLAGKTTVINGTAQDASALNGVLSPTLIGESLFQQERHRKGGAFEYQIRPTASFETSINGFYSHVDDVNFNTNFMASPKWLLQAGVAPTTATVSADGKTLLAASFAPTTASNSEINDSGWRPGALQQSTYVDWDTKWKPTDHLTVTTQIGTTRGLGQSKEYASEVGNVGGAGASLTGLDFQLNGLGTAANVAFTGANPGLYSNNVWNWNYGALVKVPDTENFGSADVDWALDAGILSSAKFGLRLTDHNRSNGNFISSGPNWANPNIGTTLPTASGQYPSNFGSAFGAPQLGQFRLTAGDIAAWASESTTANPDPNATFNYDPVLRHDWSNDFSVRERTQAAYGMANLGGDHWSGNAGVRVVQTQGHYSVLRNPTSLDAPGVIDSTSLFGPFVREFVDRTYTDVLPSASVRVDATKDLVLRGSVARVMSRPDYTALSSTTSVNDQLNTGSSGNPYLNPVRSTNIDANAEWYFAPRSLLSFGVFYMDFSSFVDYQVATSIHWSDLHKDYEPYNITQPINVGAKNKGFEIAYQQAIWGGLGANVNYTYADGKTDSGTPMAGNSKSTYNIETYYETDRFSTRLAWTHRSSFYGSYDRGTRESMAAYSTLAASVNVKINDTFSVNFDALNLNNPTMKYYGDNTEQPRAFYSNGRQFYLTFSARI
jgi:iron complex outermembrane receptor protein